MPSGGLLAGLVLTIRASGQQDQLHQIARELGASVTTHLTSDTNYLITDETGTGEAVPASQLIPILNTRWLQECYQHGVSGKSKPLENVRRFELKPIFSALKICATGIYEDERKDLVRLALENGAEISGALTKSCTHLVASMPGGSKFDFAVKSKSIHIVTLAWVYDSIRRNARLDEALYSLRISPQASQRAPVDARPRTSVFQQNRTPSVHAPNSEAAKSVSEIATNTTPHMGLARSVSEQSVRPHMRNDKAASTPVHGQVASPRDPEALPSAGPVPPCTKRVTESSLIFQSLRFTSHAFPPAEANAFRKSVEQRGGSWCSLQKMEQDSGSCLILVALTSTYESVRKNVRVVTDCWLERCLDEDKLYDETTVLLFRPLKIALPVPGFESLMISASGYESVERDHVARLAKLMGATYTEQFIRRNTHLLCKPGTDNTKCRKAKEWGIPITAVEWLYACAREGKVLEVLRFDHTSPSQAARPSSTTRTSGRPALAPVELQPRFDTAEALSSLKTPHTGLRNRSIPTLNVATPSSPLDTSFTKRLSRAAHLSRKHQFPDPDIQIDEPPDNHGPVSPPDAMEVVRAEGTSSVLDNVVVVISQKIIHRRFEISQIARSLGATVLAAYSQACTHYLHESTRVNETFTEYKSARSAGKLIVSPTWLIKCRQMGYRVPEADYPHFFNPKKALPIANPASQGSALHARQAPETPVRARHSEDLNADEGKTRAPSFEADTAPLDPPFDSRTGPPPVDYVTMIDTLMANETLGQRKTRPSLIKTREASDLDGVPRIADIFAGYTQMHAKRRGEEEIAHVSYDDPDGRVHKRKLIDDLEGVTKRPRKDHPQTEMQEVRPVVPVDLDIDEAAGGVAARLSSIQIIPDPSRSLALSPAGERPTRVEAVVKPHERVFMLSGIPRNKRQLFASWIEALGGKLLALDSWQSGVTHLITSVPARTEKCLAATAAGIWIMRPSYVQACHDAGYFLDEEPYEWVSKKDTPAADRIVFDACRRWRLKLGTYLNPAAQLPKGFDGWQVLLVVHPNKRDGFTRMLLAGGATVSTDPHAFIARPKSEHSYIITDHRGEQLRSQTVMRDLAAKQIPFIDTNYCGSYLYEDPVPPYSTSSIDIFED
ncbi:DNA topoisomerase 2-binding protein 1 [Thoreauomyces humboldtii]|nr:DNA topoisomerase 2-binding protein 1 [Thoreauomyces humboldtii]